MNHFSKNICACMLAYIYTPGTAGGPGGRDRTLAVNARKNGKKSAISCKKIKFTKNNIFLHISSSYANIFGETPVCEIILPQYFGMDKFHFFTKKK